MQTEVSFWDPREGDRFLGGREDALILDWACLAATMTPALRAKADKLFSSSASGASCT